MDFVQDMAGSRRADPGYSQLSGYIPNELVLQFKIACTTKGINLSEGIEEAVGQWLSSQKSNNTTAK